MLVDNTLFGVRDKVQIAIDRIKQFEPPEGYYVAFSGGKDSCVVLDLVKRAGVRFDAHYNLTTVDPPEVVKFIKREHPEVERHRPEKTMWQLIIQKAALPMRHQRWCCAILKENGGHGRIVTTGVRWEESNQRANRRMVEQCNFDPNKRYVHPIIDWSKNDVWEYIRKYDLPYCSLYDEGFERIGCVLCPMVTNPLLEYKRWPKIVQIYRLVVQKAWPKLVERKKKKGIEMTFKSADDWFNWWVWKRASHKKDNPDQTVMFV